MKVGILGAGTVGTTLGMHLSAADHQVLIANGCAPDSLAEKVSGFLRHAARVTLAEACPVLWAPAGWHTLSRGAVVSLELVNLFI